MKKSSTDLVKLVDSAIGDNASPEGRQGIVENLRAIELCIGNPAASSRALPAILNKAAAGPSPVSEINNFERFISALPEARSLASKLTSDTPELNILSALFGYSQFLSDVLIRHPEHLDWLVDPATIGTRRKPDDYKREASALITPLPDTVSRKNALSLWRRRELLRIGARDIMGLATMEEVTREISDLAQTVIAVALRCVRQETIERFGNPVPDAASWDDGEEDVEPGRDLTRASQFAQMCVLGMGKLGGRELNFSSDIDLIFIYDAEGETTGVLPNKRTVARQTNHFFFTKMGEALIRFLAERGPEGNLFRVDMRLRPEGNSGPIVRSLESFASYLNEQARDWERLAYLKARVMAGPPQLIERIYRLTDQFVFSDATSPAQIVREVEDLKLRIDREVMQSDIYKREVKRGYGGIREIEFVVAAMQIVYGKTHRALHVRNIYLALQRLREVHLLSAEDEKFYHRAYNFLRLVEHRLQMAEEHQTHTVPEDEAALETLARRCHFESAAAFQHEYQEITERVHELFSRFFEQDSGDMDRTSHDMLLILDREAPAHEAEAALARHGIVQPDALRIIHDLAHGTRDVFISPEGQRSFEQMLPSLLRLTTRAPSPDHVLPHFHSFVLAIKGITYYYEVIAQHPDILNLLTTLFGSSDGFSRVLVAHPEYFDTLISGQVLHEHDGVQGCRERIMGSIGSRLSLDRRLIMFRRAANFETLLIALRYLLAMRPLRDTLADLSRMADICLDAGMRLACERLVTRGDSQKPPAPWQPLYEFAKQSFAVIALGKYGGNELNFLGDLDVVFVYDDNAKPPDSAKPAEFFASLSDTLTSVLSDQLESGRVFALDARLRPDGKNAPIVVSVAQYERYLKSNAAVWELQAFLRARRAWGSEAILPRLWAAFKARCSELKPAEVEREVLEMRKSMENAAAKESGSETGFKRSPGGIVDIEFIIQFLQLAGKAPAACGEANYFDLLESSDIPRLKENYTFLRRAETAVRLVTDSSRSSLPGDEAAQEAITRLMDCDKSIAEELKTVQKSVRGSFKKCVKA